MAEQITNPVSYGGRAEQMAIGKGITDALNKTSTDKLKRDYFQQAILDQENQKFESVYDKINTIPATGVDTFDSNINSFFNAGADKIFETKNLVSEGHLSQQEGARIISETQNYITKYKTLAPKVVEQIKYYNQAKQNGTISRVNDNGMSAMLDAIANGSGDVKLLEKDGMMYLSGNGNINTKDGKQGWNYTMNIDELSNLFSDPSFAMIKTIPTFSDLGVDELFESQKGLLKGAMDTYEYTDSQGNIKTKQVYNPKRLGELMVKSGMYADLLNDPEMGVVWSDKVHGEQELGSFQQWDPNNTEMRNKMESWLIDKAIARNIPPDQIIDVQSVSGKGNTGSDGSGDGSVFMQGLFGDVKGAAKEFFDMMALDPVEVDENIESGEGGATGSDNFGKRLSMKSYTLDPQKAIGILNRYTTGDNFYSTLDNNSTSDLVAQQNNVIDNLTEADFTNENSDYNEYYDANISLQDNKNNLKKIQADAIRTTIKSLTPNDGQSRNVIVIRKGELTPTKVKGDMYSVLKEVIENTDYISGKDIGQSLNMLNYFTNKNLGGNDLDKWGDVDYYYKNVDKSGTDTNTTYNSTRN
tara:strand:- start:14155 stop:15906 length:1752 start_codon:yes stop_codon:yes gene_type:complete